jgi:peptidoglycan-N-acetylglucosamine deacetylase
MRVGLFMRSVAGIVVLGGLAAYLAGTAPVASQQIRPITGECKPGADALGVSRVVEIDTTGGPRYGNWQPGDHDFLREGEVVLTFDDGPHPAYTTPILEALDEHCVKATFFMVGRQALSFAKLARTVGSRGHTIGTHTWSHRNLGGKSAVEMRNEIELGISAVQVAIGGPTAPFFRFPYLVGPGTAQRILQERDTANISIDVDSHDYLSRSPTRIVSNILKGLQSKKKGIILLHDIQPATAAGIRTLLAELKARGYRVVHMRPKQTQSTIAAFDQRIERTHAPHRIDVAAGPVAKRAITAPAWEPFFSEPARPVATAARPRPPAPNDWWRTVFGGN